jgi:hypothetical protein
MKLISAAFGLAAMCAVAVGAQTQTTTTHTDTKRTVDVKDGKKITITGCLHQNASGSYLLTSSEFGGREYALVTDKNLSKDVGHRVVVRGKATDMGDGKVKMETKVGTTGSNIDDKKNDKAKAEIKGDVAGHFLGVDSVKRIAKSCV